VVDVDQRPSRQITVDDDFENVVVKSRRSKVPVVVESLVQEIQAVETFHPTDLDLDVEVLRVVVHPMALLGVHELVHPDHIAFRNHRPIVDFPVDARDLVSTKLKYLEGDVFALERQRG
jgi:hypothetical protein